VAQVEKKLRRAARAIVRQGLDIEVSPTCHTMNR
jgi:hypothetical protein